MWNVEFFENKWLLFSLDGTFYSFISFFQTIDHFLQINIFVKNRFIESLIFTQNALNNANYICASIKMKFQLNFAAIWIKEERKKFLKFIRLPLQAKCNHWWRQMVNRSKKMKINRFWPRHKESGTFVCVCVFVAKKSFCLILTIDNSLLYILDWYVTHSSI